MSSPSALRRSLFLPLAFALALVPVAARPEGALVASKLGDGGSVQMLTGHPEIVRRSKDYILEEQKSVSKALLLGIVPGPWGMAYVEYPKTGIFFTVVEAVMLGCFIGTLDQGYSYHYSYSYSEPEWIFGPNPANGWAVEWHWEDTMHTGYSYGYEEEEPEYAFLGIAVGAVVLNAILAAVLADSYNTHNGLKILGQEVKIGSDLGGMKIAKGFISTPLLEVGF